MFFQPGLLSFSPRLFTTVLFTLWCQMLANAQTPAPSDSVDFRQSEMTLVPDSLASRYTGAVPGDFAVPGKGIEGSFEYRRTLTQLNHSGDTIYQPFLFDPLFRDLLRQTKGTASWHPYQPGTGRNYHYGPNGTTKNSHEARLTAQRVLGPEKTVGWRLDSQYQETWGPFPNQRTTRLETMGALTIRVTKRQTIGLKVLGIDDGWYLRTAIPFSRTDRDIFLKNLTRGDPEPVVSRSLLRAPSNLCPIKDICTFLTASGRTSRPIPQAQACRRRPRSLAASCR